MKVTVYELGNKPSLHKNKGMSRDLLKSTIATQANAEEKNLEIDTAPSTRRQPADPDRGYTRRHPETQARNLSKDASAAETPIVMDEPSKAEPIPEEKGEPSVVFAADSVAPEPANSQQKPPI